MLKKLMSKECLGMLAVGLIAGSSVTGFSMMSNAKSKVGL